MVATYCAARVLVRQHSTHSNDLHGTLFHCMHLVCIQTGDGLKQRRDGTPVTNATFAQTFCACAEYQVVNNWVTESGSRRGCNFAHGTITMHVNAAVLRVCSQKAFKDETTGVVILVYLMPVRIPMVVGCPSIR